MRDLRWFIGLALSVAAVGCGDDSSSDGSGGAGGVGGAGGGASGAGACVGGGKGTLDVRIKTDNGVLGDVTLKGASGLQQDVVNSMKIEVAAGQYSVLARRVTIAGEIVGRAFYPKPTASVCLANGATQIVNVDYTLEPGSQKLWYAGGVDAVHTGAIDAADLAASGEVAASVTLAGSVMTPRTLAFDKEGNLWVGDQQGSLSMYKRDSLGASRTNAPDLVLSGEALCPPIIPCGPRALAFDNSGGLWVALADRVSHFAAASLAASGEPTADATLTGPDIMAPSALAIDATDSLWVANADAGVAKFAAARLVADSDAPADVVLTGSTPEPVIGALATPTALAFDSEGALWVGYFASNVVARYEAELLAESADVTPTTQLAIDVLSLIEAMAFDDSGSLWIGGSAGKLVRISAAQLVPGGDPNLGAVTLTSPDISYAVGIALDPPAGSTPIAR